MDNTEYYERSLQLHALNKGKIGTALKIPVRVYDDLAAVYFPGVEEPCMLIKQDKENARLYSIKANTVAVVTDGSKVSCLGNIGGLAALPAAEGKALLLKQFGDVDAFPICVDTQDADKIVETVKNITPGFGGIMLESIAAPKCFEIERKLKEMLDVPVFNDGSYGTAVVVCAAVINAFKLAGKPLSDVRAVIAGAGAAGNAIVKMLSLIGVRDMVVLDSKGILNPTRMSEFGEDKLGLLEMTNKDGISGGLEKGVRNRDFFVGAAKPGILTEELVKTMRKSPVILALSKPEPEIEPGLAKASGAGVVGTGLSCFPNLLDNALVFPGVMRGAIDAEAKDITEKMLVAAAYALAGLVSDSELAEDYVLPGLFKENVTETIAKAVTEAWKN